MIRDFAAAVADTLLPGEATAPAGAAPLPSASAVRVSIDADAHRSVLEAIATEVGGEAAFIVAAEPGRVAILRAVEAETPAAFRALVLALLADYYESDRVLGALGWTTDAPQPRGHALPPFEQEALVKVKRRARLWRG